MFCVSTSFFISPLTLLAIDPTKLRARQFGRSSGPTRDTDNSLWTETPAERQQRLADEVSGRKRRAVNADPESVGEDPEEARKRRKRDEEIRKGVEDHTVRFLTSGYSSVQDRTHPSPYISVEYVVQHSSTHTRTARLKRRRPRTRNQLVSGIMHGICPSVDG